MGIQTAPAQLFHDFNQERHVPTGYMLCEIDRFLDVDGMREALRPFKSHLRHPSIDPAPIISYVIGNRAERRHRL